MFPCSRILTFFFSLFVILAICPPDYVAAQNQTFIQQQRMLQSQRANQQALQAQRNAAQARIRQQEQARIQREQQRLERERQRIQSQQQRAQREQLLKQRELLRAQRDQQRAERATQQAARAQQQARRTQQQQSDATRKRQETEARTAILTRQQTTAIRSKLAALPKPGNQKANDVSGKLAKPANDTQKFDLKKIGPLRDPAIKPKPSESRQIGRSEGLLTATDTKFSNVKLGTYGDRDSKYIWTIDNRGVNIVKELSNQTTYKHTNLSSKAAIGGEVWFKDSKTVVINSGSGRFGDGNGNVGKSTYRSAIKAWESLGYTVEAKSFRERY